MKNLLTMTMALAAFAILEQNAKALDFKGGDFLQARGERGGERSSHPENMEGEHHEYTGESHPENMGGDHPTVNEDGHRLDQNFQNRNNENAEDAAGWTGSGAGCMTDSNGNLVCP